MNRMVLEYVFAPAKLNDVFQQAAESQYTRDLLFSSVVDLMSLVVMRSRSSVSAAYRKQREQVGVSIQAVYDKLKGIETQTSRGLVRFTAQEATALIDQLEGARTPLLSGYRVKILDGNHLSGTDHRLKVLKGTKAGALPGQSLVLLDPKYMLVTDIFLCEDGHAQERSYVFQVLKSLVARDLIIADRNFCTTNFLFGIAACKAFFLIRQHSQNLHWQLQGRCRYMGRTTTGRVYEQQVTLHNPETGEDLVARRITVKLDLPTRDGDTEIHLFTNVPAKSADAVKIAELYLQRWKLETAFQEMTVDLKCEINTLGYPKAALFGFCVAVSCYNLWAVLKATICAAYGETAVQQDLSNFYLADEIKSVHRGMMIAIPSPYWEQFQIMPIAPFCKLLNQLAKRIDWDVLQKSHRGPKRPNAKLPSAKNKHVSTAKLLAEERLRRAKQKPEESS
jgi:IS4 transposase